MTALVEIVSVLVPIAIAATALWIDGNRRG